MSQVIPRVVETRGYARYDVFLAVRRLKETIGYAKGEKKYFSNELGKGQAEEMMRDIFLPNLHYSIAKMVGGSDVPSSESYILMRIPGVYDSGSMEYADAKTLISFLRKEIEGLIKELKDQKVEAQLVFMVRKTTEGYDILVQWNNESADIIMLPDFNVG